MPASQLISLRPFLRPASALLSRCPERAPRKPSFLLPRIPLGACLSEFGSQRLDLGVKLAGIDGCLYQRASC